MYMKNKLCTKKWPLSLQITFSYSVHVLLLVVELTKLNTRIEIWYIKRFHSELASEWPTNFINPFTTKVPIITSLALCQIIIYEVQTEAPQCMITYSQNVIPLTTTVLIYTGLRYTLLHCLIHHTHVKLNKRMKNSNDIGIVEKWGNTIGHCEQILVFIYPFRNN